MSNPMKYIKDLEAVGFQRNQAEAQVQVVLDAIEGDLVTKSDFSVFKEHIDRRFAEVDHRFNEVKHRFNEVDLRFNQVELRIVTKLGLITVSSLTVAVAILGWLIRLH